MTLMIDTAKKGLSMVFKDYQEEALKCLWEADDGKSSRQVWTHTNQALIGTRTISRASIINFLNAMVDEGVLTYTEITGKGGHRKIYAAKMDENSFKQYTAEVVLGNLIRDFPEETQKAIKIIQSR